MDIRRWKNSINLMGVSWWKSCRSAYNKATVIRVCRQRQELIAFKNARQCYMFRSIRQPSGMLEFTCKFQHFNFFFNHAHSCLKMAVQSDNAKQTLFSIVEYNKLLSLTMNTNYYWFNEFRYLMCALLLSRSYCTFLHNINSINSVHAIERKFIRG
jgi:hypothetical protein